MATNNLLTQPTPHYHKFVDNQVLTDDHLNAVLDYLNHQDRLSRMLLHGVGVVCGLQLSLNASNTEIHLSDGVAVTTAGDLLKPGSKKYTGFKKFSDSNVKYPFFTDAEGETMNLWELETDTSPSDVKPLSQFESSTDISIKKAVAVLYLEDYLGEEEDCSPVDCDTQGRPVINQLRVLLISPEDAKAIAEADSIFSELLRPGNDPFARDLPRMYVPRVLLNSSNTKSYDEFKRAYAISFRTLADYISKLGSVSVFEKSFNDSGIDPVSELHNLTTTAFNFQYVYDFYKDLATAYNELRDVLKKNYAICCPDPNAFPKHVLLGTLGEPVNIWRHKFYPSPTHVESALGELNIVFVRILDMIRNFRTDIKNEIRITPSRDDDFSLRQRAVPFYYDLEKSSQPGSFLKSWKGGEDIDLTPNYYHFSYPSADFEPLNVSLEDHDFYRIEGHIGKHITDAHKKIHEIQKNKSLPFDIKQVAVGAFADELTIDYDKYRVYFEDLQVILQAWNEEQQCIMKSASNFLSQFSTKDAGSHLAYIPRDVAGSSEFNVNTARDFDTTDVFLRHGSTPVSNLTLFGKTSKPKPKENQVLKSIATKEDSLGLIINKSISTTDNKNDIWVKTNNAVGNLTREWDADLLEAAINIPGQLIGYLKETEDHKLTDIDDFTEENLEKYIASLKSQCQKTNESKKRLQKLINKENSVVRARDWTENYIYILNRITSSCCLVEKVKVLYEKIIERKQEVLNQLMLDNFIREHPGVEHKAGVERGGTFILLYYSRVRKPSRTLADLNRAEVFSAREHLTFLQPERSSLSIADFTAISESERDRFNINEVDFARQPDFGLRPTAPAFGRTPIRENIPHGTVIGDLCLPYICCSGSPSTTFVFPDQLATLRIPVDHVCVGEDEETNPISLSITPSGGTVKAFIGDRELGDAIVENENGIFFDPNKVSEEDYGTAIRFEVNGQSVEATLEINRKPNANFTVRRNIEFIRNNTIAVVTFQNTSTPFEKLSFQWDFGGEIVTNQNTVEFQHHFKVRPGENFDFEVKLTAFNGPCEDTETRSVNIDVPALEDPIEPDEPVEPDEPDQPVRDCTDVTARAIKASMNVLERGVREGGNRIGRETLSMFSQQVRPIYEAILQNIDLALGGRLDSRVFGTIKEVQASITRSIHARQNAVEQEFLLKLYYELALLYFYIQACRTNQISGEIAMISRRENWLTFTQRAIEGAPEAMKAMLQDDKIHNKFESVHQQMGGRFDGNMRSIVLKTIEVITGFFGR